MARYSPAQNKAVQKYIKNNYDMLRIRIRKDADTTKADIQAAADRAGESMAEYITGAIRQRMEREEKDSL